MIKLKKIKKKQSTISMNSTLQKRERTILSGEKE